MVAGMMSWCWWPDSNGRPTDYESVALPAELHQRIPLISVPLQRVARHWKLYQCAPIGGSRRPSAAMGRTSDLSVMVCQDSVASIFARERAEGTQAAASRAALKNRGSIWSRVIFWRIERA